MNKYLDTIYKNITALRVQASLLRKYANALDTIGSDKLSTELFDISYIIDNSIESIENAVNKKVDIDYQSTVKNSHELMRGILLLTSNNEEC